VGDRVKKRAEIIGHAYRRYHAGEITLAELVATITGFRKA